MGVVAVAEPRVDTVLEVLEALEVAALVAKAPVVAEQATPVAAVVAVAMLEVTRMAVTVVLEL